MKHTALLCFPLLMVGCMTQADCAAWRAAAVEQQRVWGIPGPAPDCPGFLEGLNNELGGAVAAYGSAPYPTATALAPQPAASVPAQQFPPMLGPYVIMPNGTGGYTVYDNTLPPLQMPPLPR